MRFSYIRALDGDHKGVPPMLLARTTFPKPAINPADRFQPAPNRASRRGNGQYRSNGRGAIYRGIRNMMRNPLPWKPVPSTESEAA